VVKRGLLFLFLVGLWWGCWGCSLPTIAKLERQTGSLLADSWSDSKVVNKSHSANFRGPRCKTGGLRHASEGGDGDSRNRRIGLDKGLLSLPRKDDWLAR
jgi:hypothetical protein